MHDALAGGAIITFTLLASAATRFFGAFSPTTMVVSADNSSLTIFAVGGVRASESRTMRRSFGAPVSDSAWLTVVLLGAGPEAGVRSRSVKLGSSARIV